MKPPVHQVNMKDRTSTVPGSLPPLGLRDDLDAAVEDVVLRPADALRLVVPGWLDTKTRSAIRDILDRNQVHGVGVGAVHAEVINVITIRQPDNSGKERRTRQQRLNNKLTECLINEWAVIHRWTLPGPRPGSAADRDPPAAPWLPHWSRKPHPLVISSHVRRDQLLSWRIRAPRRIRGPIVHKTFREAWIIQDLPGRERRTKRSRATARVGVTTRRNAACTGLRPRC
jgi:hypothetical protein